MRHIFGELFFGASMRLWNDPTLRLVDRKHQNAPAHDMAQREANGVAELRVVDG
jgi:hypothetical protein